MASAVADVYSCTMRYSRRSPPSVLVSGWLAVEHLEIEPEIAKFIGQRGGEPPRLAADPAEDGRRAGLVVDLHEELTPAVLDELRSRRPGCDFHAHFVG